MAVALASSCNSDSTPSLLAWEFPYTTGASLKKKKKKKEEEGVAEGGEGDRPTQREMKEESPRTWHGHSAEQGSLCAGETRSKPVDRHGADRNPTTDGKPN